MYQQIANQHKHKYGIMGELKIPPPVILTGGKLIEDLKTELNAAEQADKQLREHLQKVSNDILRVQGIIGFLKEKIDRLQKGEKVEEDTNNTSTDSNPVAS